MQCNLLRKESDAFSLYASSRTHGQITRVIAVRILAELSNKS